MPVTLQEKEIKDVSDLIVEKGIFTLKEATGKFVGYNFVICKFVKYYPKENEI